MRYLGQEHTVKVPVPNGNWDEKTLEEIIGRFHQLHEKKTIHLSLSRLILK